MEQHLITLTICLFLCAQAFAAPDEVGKHLFILFGQSNMERLHPNISFTPAVEAALGKDHVIVVKDAQGGQPILRWYGAWKPVKGDSPKADPGEKTTVITDHPEVVASLRTAYDQWWSDVQPLLVNENVTTAPNVNPLKELYWKQFGGGPDARMPKRMAPSDASDEEEQPAKLRRKKNE